LKFNESISALYIIRNVLSSSDIDENKYTSALDILEQSLEECTQREKLLYGEHNCLTHSSFDNLVRQLNRSMTEYSVFAIKDDKELLEPSVFKNELRDVFGNAIDNMRFDAEHNTILFIVPHMGKRTASSKLEDLKSIINQALATQHLHYALHTKSADENPVELVMENLNSQTSTLGSSYYINDGLDEYIAQHQTPTQRKNG
jgi:hypothetical protein